MAIYIQRFFQGRISRNEFLFSILCFVFGMQITVYTCLYFAPELSLQPVITLYGIVIAIPFFSVVVRRLHDLGHPGNAAFMLYIPLRNLYLIVDLYFMSGEEQPNAYGQKPNKFSLARLLSFHKETPA